MTTPRRVQLSRKKGWKMPPNTVKVCRGASLNWGNPFRVGDNGDIGVLAAEEAVAMYTCWLLCTSIGRFRLLAIGELSGKNLACWCALDAPCHADVLLEVANTADPKWRALMDEMDRRSYDARQRSVIDGTDKWAMP